LTNKLKKGFFLATNANVVQVKKQNGQERKIEFPLMHLYG